MEQYDGVNELRRFSRASLRLSPYSQIPLPDISVLYPVRLLN